MKKMLSVIMSIILVCMSVGFAYAEEDGIAGTQFEQVLLQKGSLIKKEVIDIAEILDSSGYEQIVTSQVVILTDMTNGTKVHALRLTYTYLTGKRLYEEKVGVLDLEEIDSVISTLKLLKTEFAGNLIDYTEFMYTSNSGIKVGGYHSSNSSSDRLFIKFTSSISAKFKVSRIDELISFFENAKTDIEGRMH